MSNEQFKRNLNNKINSAAFRHLEQIKATHSKVSQIEYSALEVQPYLKSTQLNIHGKELLILLRLRMTKTKTNYRSCLLYTSPSPRAS